MTTAAQVVKKKSKEIGEDLDDIKKNASEINSSLADSVEQVKENTEKFVQETVDHVKESCSDLKDALVKYCKSNPIKALGFAVVTGFLASHLLRK